MAGSEPARRRKKKPKVGEYDLDAAAKMDAVLDAAAKRGDDDALALRLADHLKGALK